MRDFDEQNITEEVIASIAESTDSRLKAVAIRRGAGQNLERARRLDEAVRVVCVES